MMMAEIVQGKGFQAEVIRTDLWVPKKQGN